MKSAKMFFCNGGLFMGMIEQYNVFIEEIESKIKKLQMRYKVKRQILEYDYGNGEIDRTTYLKAKHAKINQYVEGLDERYMLSKNEISFIDQYTIVDADGYIHMKREILEKQNLLNQIFRSVIIYHYFDSFEEEDKKEKILEVLKQYFDFWLVPLYKRFNEIKRLKGDNCFHSLDCKDCFEKINRIEKTKSCYIKDLFSATSKEQITVLLDSIFSIDSKFYAWYKSQYYSSQLQEGTIFQEHVLSTLEANRCMAQNQKKINSILSLRKELNFYVDGLLASDTNLNQFKIKPCIKDRIRYSRIDRLKQIFTSLFYMNGLLLFLKSFSTDSVIHVEECFINYLTYVYGNAPAVSEKKFLCDLREKVLSFYKNKIAELRELIALSEQDYFKESEVIGNNISLINRQAILQKELFTRKGKIEKIEGLDDKELAILYKELKEYLSVENTIDLDSLVVPLENNRKILK